MLVFFCFDIKHKFARNKIDLMAVVLRTKILVCAPSYAAVRRGKIIWRKCVLFLLVCLILMIYYDYF